MKQTPIDELMQAIASANAEREKLRQLVRDYRVLLERCIENWTMPVGSVDELQQRAKELLGEPHE